jgi:hypothetical protein
MLSEKELNSTVIAALLRITLITGWQLPSDDAYRKLLYAEFSRLLVEQYKTINQEEIAYSMRKYGTRIKDWGKNINLSLISEALDLYLIERAEVSKIESMKPKEEQKMIKYKQSDEEVVEFWKNEWREFKSKNWLAFIGGIICFPLLEKEMDFTDEEMKEMVATVKRVLIENCKGNRQEERKMRELFKDFKNIYPAWQKLAVARYFTKQIEIENF